MTLTPAQQQAVAARGNVLVIAGAGTGKTHTLVERCLDCVLKETPPVSLDEILMVTFTEAAATEMRGRIRSRLEEVLNQNPQHPRWQEQLALFETAHIGTLHSFCLKLVRQHFYLCELDPQLSVLEQEEANLLAAEELGSLLEKHYAGRTPEAEAVQQLIQAHGQGWDRPIRWLVLRLHHYTQTLPDPPAWFRAQIASFEAAKPVIWQQWLAEALAGFPERWISLLQRPVLSNDLSQQCLAALQKMKAGASNAETAAALKTIITAGEECPKGKKTAWLKPLNSFLGEAEFLFSLTGAGNSEPLTEDWAWVRPQMLTLLHLAEQFTAAFTNAKRELGMLDFHDLEQYALRLLWEPKTNQPTAIAREWRQKLRFVFVDEYQDINAAQDKIIEALSREGASANRFLVGDVKQSIYRFRLANPRIFKHYAATWRTGNARTIALVENFRSREPILRFINSLFTLLMKPDMGGVAYDDEAALRFGAFEHRRALSAAADPAPRVELHLRVKGNGDQFETGEELPEAVTLELEETDKEARLAALRLLELKAERHQIWDEEAEQFRPVDWRDMAILLRSPAAKAESYAKEFSRLRVPLLVERGGFYESLEVSDLLGLLQLLDNPLQDLPLLAVLRSPLVGLALDELATIRLTQKGPFWNALVRWSETRTKASPAAPTSAAERAKAIGEESPLTLRGMARPPGASLAVKVSTFLRRFAHWRRLARQVSLSRSLEAVLSETHYASWLLTQPRGEQRHANVRRLVVLAQQFDQFQRQGLFRFLLFIEAQQLAEAEPGVAALSGENAVRLMSIHQSKGLEFPVVVVADMGKAFNLADLHADLILDDVYGLCPQIKPPQTGKRYPSLPYWLAQRRQQNEVLGEELRLLYVAMTRARDTLILSGSLSIARFNLLWQGEAEAEDVELISPRTYLDWLGLWFAQHAGVRAQGDSQGKNEWLRWFFKTDTDLRLTGDQTAPAPEAPRPLLTITPDAWQRLQQRLEWKYPYAAATHKPAKTSVSVLRRRAAEVLDEESRSLFEAQGPRFSRGPSTSLSAAKFSGVETGSAHHRFLQLVSLGHVQDSPSLRAESERLVRERAMTQAEAGLLDFDGLAAFWQSALGRQIRSQSQNVHRELAFTIRLSQPQLDELMSQPGEPNLENEFVVVQGVADLVVLLPEEIWLVDFKTDSAKPNEMDRKVQLYGPQLKLYSRALCLIYQRPVSACWLYFLSARKAVEIQP